MLDTESAATVPPVATIVAAVNCSTVSSGHSTAIHFTVSNSSFICSFLLPDGTTVRSEERRVVPS